MLPGIYPKELKTYIDTKTCTLMFVTASFITAKMWKQPRCRPVGKLEHEGNGMLFSSEKEMSHQVTKDTRTLKCILLSERNQAEKVL